MSTSPSTTMTTDLRHVTSNLKDHHRPGRRTSQHLRTTDGRLGSPNSIPSSPTSIHSSSSAIFERDIEPIMPPSPPTHSHRSLDPHRIPRARATEQLEQSVPSVLDSAAAILQDDASVEQIAVVAPAPSVFEGLSAGSGFASPLSLRSRSPSPLGSRAPESLLLLNIPSTSSSPPLPVVTLQARVPAVTSTNTTHTEADVLEATPSPPTKKTSTVFTPSSPLSSPTSLSSHPPSPTHVATKRLSFMSYSDLLTSTPASTHTLSSLTTSASSSEPPPHIPSVSGLNLVSATASVASASGSLRGFSLGSGASGGLTHPGKRDSIALLDNVGGEWEREGLGRGLEERLESGGVSPGVGTTALPVYVSGGKA